MSPHRNSRRVGAAVASSTIGALLLAGCGTIDAASPGAGPVNVAAVDAHIRALDVQVNGTLAQRSAREYLSYVSLQGTAEKCMSEGGEKYDPPSFEGPLAGDTVTPLPAVFPEAGDTDAAITAREGFGMGAALDITGKHDAAMNDPGTAATAKSPTYFTTLQGCTSDAVDEAYPAFANSINQSFMDVLSDAVRQSGGPMSDQDYAACMDKAGIQAASHDQAIQDIGQLYVPFTANASGWERRGDAFAAAQAREFVVAEADATCLRPAHEAFARVVAPMLSTFETTHAADLKASAHGWADLQSKATQAQADWTAQHPRPGL